MTSSFLSISLLLLSNITTTRYTLYYSSIQSKLPSHINLFSVKLRISTFTHGSYGEKGNYNYEDTCSWVWLPPNMPLCGLNRSSFTFTLHLGSIRGSARFEWPSLLAGACLTKDNTLLSAWFTDCLGHKPCVQEQVPWAAGSEAEARHQESHGQCGS